jgi:tetratricopeptide (TPR) repeat protein
VLKNRPWIVLAGCVAITLFALQSKVTAQAPMAGKASADYSKEALVIESGLTTIAFENDGTSNVENIERTRIQSQAGVQAFGIIHVPYPSQNATVEIVYVRVNKPDGRVVVTPAGNVMDMPAAVTQSAPLYSDLHDKQVPVKGLEIGDVLEYDVKVHFHTPMVPGQFWYAYDFNHSNIVLAEELRISVPKDRTVKVSSREMQPVNIEDGNRKTYTWKSSNPDRKVSDDLAKTKSLLHVPPPAVQITTFRGWNEIAQWYGGLEESASKPTPELKALAEKLTQGATSEKDKTKILYKYVATKIRYVGLDFGIGRYEPHPAEDVLDNEYGDCKDKHTLLAALLSAVGVKSYPALVNSSREIDPDVPSPSQFDHVVTYVPQGNSATWLDTTAEVLPFGMLSLNLRDRYSLVVAGGAAAKLVKPPADAPLPSTMDFQIAGKLDAEGTYTAKIEISFRGDMEYIFRSAFRNIPQPRVNDGVQGMSGAWGFAGTVRDATISSPEDTDEPFHISYTYVRPDYGDWPTKRIVAPFPQPMITPIRDDKESENEPVEMGPPVKITLHGKIELPDGFSPMIPQPSKISYEKDFAAYEGQYSVSGNTFQIDRNVETTVREVPASRRAEYVAFQKSVSDDETRFIQLTSASDWKTLGGSTPNPEAVQYYNQAQQATQGHDPTAVIDNLKRATELDPKFLQARKSLSDVLMAFHDSEEALKSYKVLEKMDPSDVQAAVNIGSILLSLNRPAEAVPELESATERFPDNAQLAMQLGRAYARSGGKQKALPPFRKATRLDSSALMLNNVAYELADAGVGLDDALGYAEKAVEELEEQSTGIKLEDSTSEQSSQLLTHSWDTIGWVHFRLGHYEQAEKYLRAAWVLERTGVIGEHLGEVYEKEGKKQEAIHAYALAVTTQGAEMNKVLDKVQKLSGSDLKGDDAVLAAQKEHPGMVKLPRMAKGKAMAQFLLLFTQGSNLPEVKFLNGSDELRDAVKTISAARFDIIFPDARPAKILRWGTLSCEPSGPTCDFILLSSNMLSINNRIVTTRN